MKAQLISVSEASRLVGQTREKVANAARRLEPRRGPRGAKLYDASDLMRALFCGEGQLMVFELDRIERERMP